MSWFSGSRTLAALICLSFFGFSIFHRWIWPNCFPDTCTSSQLFQPLNLFSDDCHVFAVVLFYGVVDWNAVCLPVKRTSQGEFAAVWRCSSGQLIGRSRMVSRQEGSVTIDHPRPLFGAPVLSASPFRETWPLLLSLPKKGFFRLYSDCIGFGNPERERVDREPVRENPNLGFRTPVEVAPFTLFGCFRSNFMSAIDIGLFYFTTHRCTL